MSLAKYEIDMHNILVNQVVVAEKGVCACVCMCVCMCVLMKTNQ